jgi:uncharacterized protein
MRSNVAQLLKASVGSTRVHQMEDALAGLDASNPFCTVSGEVTLTRTNRSIMAKGALTTSLVGVCSRCLEEFRYTATFTFVEEYFPSVDVITGRPLPRPEDPSSFTIDPNHMLDLTEAVRQYIILSMPMQPLCQADCAGLCPVCGQNLNVQPCRCAVDDTDPRWAVLQKLGTTNL